MFRIVTRLFLANLILAKLILAKLIVVGLIVLGLASCQQEAEGPVVKTANGEVQGFMHDSVHMFYGIPYAQPPVGALRWQLPQPVVNWTGVRDATTAGPLCFQYMLYMQRGVEDCLYLNVATPDVKPATPKPVMVWIHGGGFIGGSSLEATPIEHLAQHGDVVVVSMNYRVGALGFMAHPALSAEAAKVDGKFASGNFGLLDQQAALRWVRDNVAAFGGDPQNVTIFGESAGGMSVCVHLASPQSAGLFKQAIIQSGPCMSHNPSLPAAEKQGEYLAIKAGCEGRGDLLDCLRSKTPEEIMKALPNDPAFVFGEGEFGAWGVPIVDGRVLTDTLKNSFDSGHFNRVPVINGNNGDEGSLLVMFSHEYRFAALKAEQYEQRIRYLVGNDDAVVAKIKARYPLENYPDPGAALSALFGDSFMACSVQRTSGYLAKWTPLYGYIFAYPGANFILPELRQLNAFHGAELQFVFDEPMRWLRRHFSGAEKQLSDTMMDKWTQFARTGKPDKEGEQQWPLFSDGGKQLVFDLQLSVSDSEKREACAFWRDLGIPDRNGLAHYEKL